MQYRGPVRQGACRTPRVTVAGAWLAVHPNQGPRRGSQTHPAPAGRRRPTRHRPPRRPTATSCPDRTAASLLNLADVGEGDPGPDLGIKRRQTVGHHDAGPLEHEATPHQAVEHFKAVARHDAERREHEAPAVGAGDSDDVGLPDGHDLRQADAPLDPPGRASGKVAREQCDGDHAARHGSDSRGNAECPAAGRQAGAELLKTTSFARGTPTRRGGRGERYRRQGDGGGRALVSPPRARAPAPADRARPARAL